MQEEINVDEAQVARVLHYVVNGKCKPAIVENSYLEEPGRLDLVVFNLFDTLYTENVFPNHLRRVNKTWHWPRECIHIKEIL